MMKFSYENVTDYWLQELHTRWSRGQITKVDIERNYFDDVKSQGKRISREWREKLGIETEQEHPLVIENARLKARVQHLEEQRDNALRDLVMALDRLEQSRV